MTTIAWRFGFIAADSRATFEDGTIEICEKLFRIRRGPNKGCIVGTYGSAFPGMKFVEWFGAPGTKEPPKIEFEDDDFCCVVIKPDSKVFTVNQHLNLVECIEPYYAIGSGGPIALGAMDKGATAIEAVRIACKRSAYSGPPIKWINYRHRS